MMKRSLIPNCTCWLLLAISTLPSERVAGQEVNAQQISAYVLFKGSENREPVGSMEISMDPIGRKQTAPVVSALAASPDGRFLAVAGDDHAIRVVDVKAGEILRTFVAHEDWIQSLEFSQDGQRLYSAANDGRVLAWENAFPVEPKELIQVPFAIRDISCSAEQQLLAIGGFHHELIVLDLNTLDIKHRLACDCGDQRCVQFSPNGELLLCGGRDGSVHVWDSTTGATVTRFQQHRSAVGTAAFSSDGSKVTSVGEDRQLIQYDLATRQVTLKRELVQAKLKSMCLINDQMVAIAGADNSIHLYDAIADEIVAHLQGHFGTVGVMTPCGAYLVSGSFDTTVRIWDLETIEQNNIQYGRPVHAPLKMDTRLRVR